jgi:chromosome segregation ATPase
VDGAVASLIGGSIIAALGAASVLGSKAIETATTRKAASERDATEARAIRDELRGDNDRLDARLLKAEERLERRQQTIYECREEIIALRGKCSSENLRLEIALSELARCQGKTRAEVRKELFNGSSD